MKPSNGKPVLKQTIDAMTADGSAARPEPIDPAVPPFNRWPWARSGAIRVIDEPAT